jgi:hypothetical protein
LVYSLGVAVETYVLETNKSRPTLKQRSLSVLFMASAYFVAMFAWTFFWPTPFEAREGLSWMALKAAFIGLFWGVGMTFWSERLPNRKLIVEDESITNVVEYTGWMKWYKIRRTVSAGKVRTIREIKPRLGMPGGLAASERTGFGAWMWGGIYIPKTLPEYEQLKALVESWRTPGTAA